MGAFDWLFTDPYQSGGGILAQVLGLNKANPGALTSTPVTPSPSAAMGPFSPGYGAPLLGNSPFTQLIRGGLTGLAASTGTTGLSALGSGFVGAEQGAQQRRQWQTQNQLSALDLYRQRALLGSLPPWMGGGANSGTGGQDGAGAGGMMPPGVVGPAGGHYATTPRQRIAASIRRNSAASRKAYGTQRKVRHL